MARKVWIALAFLAGSIFFALSAILEHSASGLPAGMSNDLSLRMSALQQTVSAGSTRIFAGLCFVAAAVLFSAGDRRPADKASAGPGTSADRPRA
jgi:hypothetical protein